MNPETALIQALSIASIPEIEWKHGDDLCDCTFQRIGMWKNIYLAQTHEIRPCCLYAKLAEMFPGLFRSFDGYLDDNTGEWITDPQPWNGEDDMPQALWHRQLARLLDIDLPAARAMNLSAPLGQPRFPGNPFFLRVGGDWQAIEL